MSDPPRELTREVEEAFALAMGPKIVGFMDHVRAQLPDGTHFAILIEAQGGGVARMLAGSTDRRRMSVRAAEWALSVRNTPPETDP